MKLNHLNLTVTEVGPTRDLLVTHFGLTNRGGDSTAIGFLTDDDGQLVLTLIRAQKGETVAYPSSFHIGFIQPSAAHVDEINRRLKDDGYEVPPPSKQHGSWTFYFRAPGGFVIEVLS